MSSPEPSRPPLDADRLAGLLPARWRARVSLQDPSTNATCAGLARAAEPEGAVVVTEHQTVGRGRLDRTWETPARSSLTFSVLLRPEIAPERWPWLPLLTGYAVRQGLRDHGVAAQLKWPNDVLLDQAKVAGILLERVETSLGPAAVVGVGLNVSQQREELPVAHATSLALQGAYVDRTQLLGDLLRQLHDAYHRWQREASASDLPAAYQEACDTLGRVVRVQLPEHGLLVGRAVGVDPYGRLLVDGSHGVVPVSAGDVVHVRPAE